MRNVSATSFSSSDEDPPRVARLPSGLKTRLSLLRKSEPKRQQQLDPTRLSPLSARPPVRNPYGRNSWYSTGYENSPCWSLDSVVLDQRPQSAPPPEYEHHPKPMRHHEVDPYKGQVAFYKDSISMSPQGRHEREKRHEADAKPCCCGLFEVGTVNTAAAWIGSWLTGVGTIMLYGLAASGKCFGGCLH
ncbi:hypothetical protein PG997_006704 [Apiospora hydei]|uniref:Uncharacterized protein n=1 Tax=Apiospora hydei TaxID=1337664 RepID=A0ABR1WPU5_9PEZI